MKYKAASAFTRMDLEPARRIGQVNENSQRNMFL